MKSKRLSLCWRASFGVLLAALTTASIPASADNATAPVFDVQASLITPKEINLGEPILVYCNIKNVSGQDAVVRMSKFEAEWYTVTLCDVNNGLVAPTALESPSTSAAETSPVSPARNTFSHSGETFNRYILVNKLSTIQHPGKYIITLHVRLPYTLVDDASLPGALKTMPGAMQTQDIVLPILVTKPSVEHIHATAIALQKAVSDPTIGGDLVRADMDALFSMPETQVSAIWRDLANIPSMNNDLVATELTGLKSETSINILAQMLDNPSLHCTPISDRLNTLYNNGTPSLRDYIKKIAATHGIEMPQIAGAPVQLD
jgi:hypothetical protein